MSVLGGCSAAIGGSGNVRVDDTTQREQTYELDLQKGDTVKIIVGIQKGSGGEVALSHDSQEVLSKAFETKQTFERTITVNGVHELSVRPSESTVISIKAVLTTSDENVPLSKDFNRAGGFLR